jgi:DNA polymerase-1
LDRAEAFRPLIRESGREKCADCKYLWQCYYTAEFKRLRKELEHIERQAVNTKIQGSAADLTNLGIVRTGEIINSAGYEAILTNYVHDEVIFRVPVDSNVDLFKEDFGRAMMSVQEYISVPLKFVPKVAKTWAKLK